MISFLRLPEGRWFDMEVLTTTGKSIFPVKPSSFSGMSAVGESKQRTEIILGGMKMKKKLLSLVLTLCLVLTLVPVCQRRCSRCDNGCKQKEKAQPIME